MPAETLKIGALRGGDPERPGQWVVASPGDRLFSTVCFFATEVWNGRNWERMMPDEQLKAVDLAEEDHL